MTSYDHLLPLAKRLITGLAGKPGVNFVDKNMAANYLAQALAGAPTKAVDRDEQRTVIVLSDNDGNAMMVVLVRPGESPKDAADRVAKKDEYFREEGSYEAFALQE